MGLGMRKRQSTLGQLPLEEFWKCEGVMEMRRCQDHLHDSGPLASERVPDTFAFPGILVHNAKPCPLVLGRDMINRVTPVAKAQGWGRYIPRHPNFYRDLEELSKAVIKDLYRLN